MIYLKLFLTFLEIGLFTFGGGYAMISLIRDKALMYGWLSEVALLNMIAVAVLPSFIIILLISAVLRNFLKYQGVQAFLRGVRPCVVALILATAVTMALSTLLDITTLRGGCALDARGMIILAALVAIALIFQKVRKKKPSPILMILISAGLGMILYSA